MGVISGENGAVYYNAAITDTALANGITYSTGATGDYVITSSTDNNATGIIDFETKGYEATMLFSLDNTSTGLSNDRIYTIVSCSSGVLVVTESLTNGTDTGMPVFAEAEPGLEVGGFFNWTVTYSGDALETSAFDDSSGGKTYIGGLTNWSGSADKHWLTSSNVVSSTGGSWMGSTGIRLRLFTKFVAIPSTGNPSQYWNGNITITGLDHNTARDAVINQSVGFQGQGLLTLTTKTAAWNTTG